MLPGPAAPHPAEQSSVAWTGLAQPTIGSSIRQRKVTANAALPVFSHPASVDTQTGKQMHTHAHPHTYSCRLANLLTANGNGQKEASGRPVEISHLIALHLQVASMVLRRSGGLLSRRVVARIHKVCDARQALTWSSPPPPPSALLPGLGPHRHLLSLAAGA